MPSTILSNFISEVNSRYLETDLFANILGESMKVLIYTKNGIMIWILFLKRIKSQLGWHIFKTFQIAAVVIST